MTRGKRTLTRPGGRSARVRAKVLDAFVELLAEEGVAAVSLEKVADRAGVHRSTLYRRWRTVDALLADAVVSTTERTASNPPDNGNVADDLIDMAKRVRDLLSEGAPLTRALASHSPSSEEMTVFVRWFWLSRIATWTTVVERAIARGELKRDSDPKLIVLAIYGPLFLGALMHEPIEDDVVVSLVRQALAAHLAD